MFHFIAYKKSYKVEDIIQKKFFVQELFKLHNKPRINDYHVMYMAIKLQMAICHNPQANGQVGKVKQILTVNITSVLNPHGSEWLNVLSMIEFVYNNIYQSTIKSSLPLAYYLQALPKFALSHVEELVNRAV